MRKPVLSLAVALVLLAVFGVVLTARFGFTQTPPSPVPPVGVDPHAAERLAGAIRIPTISADSPEAFDAGAFQKFHTYLETTFPLVHSGLRREVVGTHSLLYTWQGTDRSVNPILLLGHMDVVPVESEPQDGWAHDPFGGLVRDGFIWGRGAIDNKSAVVGILESVEMLLAEGFRPARTVHLAYGHDEEVGGTGGAREIAALLKRRGVKLEMVLDEGGIIGDGVVAGVRAPVALVGIAEKGFLTLELEASVEGGHSSLPPAQSAVGIVSAAIARLEQNPMPARLEGPTRQMFDHIGPELPTLQRVLFANLWLTRGLVVRRLQEHPATNAMLRTTTTPTIFQAGTKDNVLPGRAKAAINARIAPGDSIEAVMAHVTRVVDDERVSIRAAGRFTAEPSPVSSTDAASFRLLERTIRSVVPDAIVAPFLVVVATDARHYAELSENVFRFLPLRLASPDLARMHGIDERVSVADYETAIRAYRQFVINAAGV